MSWRFSLAFLDPQLALFCFPFCEISNESASRVVRRFVVLHCSGRCSCSLDASAIEILWNFDEFRVSTFDTFWVSFIFICSKFYQLSIWALDYLIRLWHFFQLQGSWSNFEQTSQSPTMLQVCSSAQTCADGAHRGAMQSTSARAKWR